MSNSLAIAAVTTTLQYIVQELVKGLDGARVTAQRPDTVMASKSAGGEGVNIYLYHIAPNAALRNSDLPTRASGGALVAMPQVALDLYYLFSFFGDEQVYIPQILLGAVVSGLHVRPMLFTSDTATAEREIGSMLAKSGLLEQVERVRIALQPLSLEELSKLWSIFFQAPYVLSVAYQVSVVLIEGENTRPVPALPVREVQLSAQFRQPVIEAIRPMTVEVGDSIVITGRNLWGDGVEVRFDGGDGPGKPTAWTDSHIELPILGGLRAGVRTVHVRHPVKLLASKEEPHWIVSNLAVFVLRPKIVSNSVKQRSPQTLELAVEPAIQKGQKVAVLLNTVKPKDSTTQNAYHIDVLLDKQIGEPSFEKLNVDLPKTFVSGTYTVRVQVDGAESLPYERPAVVTE